MGILASLDLSIRNASYNDKEGWFADWIRGDVDSDSGTNVNESSAMKIATVFKCVNWRAKMFGMLPKKIFERVEILGRSSQREARQHPLYPLIHTAPNPTITSTSWFGLVSADVHLWGNSYAYIERASKSNRIVGLWRIMPDAVRIEREAGKLWYFIHYGDGREERFYPDEILHIRGLGFDGIRGYSPIQMQKQTLGWTKATHKFSANFYRNAFRPSGLLISPQSMKAETKKGLIDNLRAQGKEGGLALIEGALEYKPMGIPQDDAQFIETMNYQDDDICGIMEVKPHKVGIMRNMTNNNVEQQNIEAVTDCIQPFAVSVEQWIDLQLLSDFPSSGRGGGTERDRFFMQCELKGLLRGDTAAQTALLIAMRDRGIYDGNDCADYLGNPPFEGGDVRVINAAYVPLDMLEELATAKATAPAPGAPNPDGGPAPKASVETSLKQIDPLTVVNAYAPLYRHAVVRVASRAKPSDREKAALEAFRPLAGSTSIILGAFVADEFLDGITAAVGVRARDWSGIDIDETATAEHQRVVAAIQGRQA